MRPLCLAALTAVAFAAAAPAADPVVIARPDAFPTLVNPACSHCVDEAKRRAADLTDFDRVLAWTRGKYDGGAIPLRFFLNPYRVISDTYGVFVYDPDAGYARGFEPSLDFRFHGWRNGVMVMKHQDGTLFSGLSGVAFDGPRKGMRPEAGADDRHRLGAVAETVPGYGRLPDAAEVQADRPAVHAESHVGEKSAVRLTRGWRPTPSSSASSTAPRPWPGS